MYMLEVVLQVHDYILLLTLLQLLNVLHIFLVLHISQLVGVLLDLTQFLLQFFPLDYNLFDLVEIIITLYLKHVVLAQLVHSRQMRHG